MSALDQAAVWHDERPKTLWKYPRTTVLRSPHVEIGDIDTRTDSLCGQVDCKRCDQPRPQQLVSRTVVGAEHWRVLPCACGGAP
jgi:hypothetical protein